MKSTRSFVYAALVSGLAAASFFTLARPAKAQTLSPVEARQIAQDAYVYGYSLITTEVTRVQMSNVPKVEGFTAPMGQFINVPKYPLPDVHLVSAPNVDGSLTFHFQNESPGKDKEANWLPAPKGDFLPMLRMYWPKDTSPSIVNGSWTVPAVVKAN
jgi:hypothetical protein